MRAVVRAGRYAARENLYALKRKAEQVEVKHAPRRGRPSAGHARGRSAASRMKRSRTALNRSAASCCTMWLAAGTTS